MDENFLLTAAEAAKEKDTHIKSIYRAIKEGRLKAERRSQRILLIRRADLMAWEPNTRIKQALKKQAEGAA